MDSDESLEGIETAARYFSLGERCRNKGKILEVEKSECVRAKKQKWKKILRQQSVI